MKHLEKIKDFIWHIDLYSIKSFMLILVAGGPLLAAAWFYSNYTGAILTGVYLYIVTIILEDE